MVLCRAGPRTLTWKARWRLGEADSPSVWTSPPEEHGAGGFDLSPGQTCLFLTQVRPEDFSAWLRSGELGWEARLQTGPKEGRKRIGSSECRPVDTGLTDHAPPRRGRLLRGECGGQVRKGVAAAIRMLFKLTDFIFRSVLGRRGKRSCNAGTTPPLHTSQVSHGHGGRCATYG